MGIGGRCTTIMNLVGLKVSLNWPAAFERPGAWPRGAPSGWAAGSRPPMREWRGLGGLLNLEIDGGEANRLLPICA